MTETAPELTPMMLQYRELKQRYPDYLLLFRLGDFYELFFEDAHAAARLLQITLTSRQKGEGAIPMAGIRTTPPTATSRASSARARRSPCASRWRRRPRASWSGARSCASSRRAPSPTRSSWMGPRTTSSSLLHRAPGALGAALVDVSTGDFWVGEQDGAGAALLEAALLRRPAELLVARDAAGNGADRARRSAWP